MIVVRVPRQLVRIVALTLIASTVMLALPDGLAHAQSVPATIPHQGRLLNSLGQPITTQVSVIFAVYDAQTGGAQVWNETQSITPDSLGFYDTMLGQVTPLPAALPSPAYLQITVQGEALSPRLQFGAVPFAQVAANGVPSGFSILGDTPTSPPGFTLAGAARVGDNWLGEAPMPTARYSLATAAVNNKIYAIGGANVGYLATVEEYDPATNTWATKAPMPTARSYLAAAAVNSKIYAIGGSNPGNLATVEEYDPATNTWAAKAPMPTARFGLATAVVNNKIYAIGGANVGYLATVEEYDPATNTWAAKAPMPTARENLGTAAVNNKIYAIGGVNNGVVLATVEEYDPATNTWATKAPMPTARYFLAAAAVNNKIYAIGGAIVGVWFATVEEYDPATNTWATKAPMPTARYVLAAAVVNNNIYAIGGYNGGNLATVEEYFAPRVLYLHQKN